MNQIIRIAIGAILFLGGILAMNRMSLAGFEIIIMLLGLAAMIYEYIRSFFISDKKVINPHHK